MAVSAKQLEKYHDALLDMRRRVVGHVEHVVHAINDESNTLENLSSVPVHLADVAQPGLVADAHVLDRENDMLVEIDEALARIQQGTYGVCTDCGQEINNERLQALPFVKTCLSCAEVAQGDGRSKPR